jgi:agmatine deiminase
VTIAPPPAEWAPHKAVWIGFPSHPELWQEDLDPARDEVVAFARAVHADGRGETVILVAAVAEAGAAATALAPFAEVVVEPFGDIWLRDTGPIVLANGEARDFGFNGWGGKYDLPGDDTIGLRLAKGRGKPVGYCNWVLEGGAIDGDGTGVVVTTEQCLLNPNRNPALGKTQIEARLREDLGFTRIVWLGDGLLNDHTDGHVDNLARFVAPGRLALPQAAENDPNCHPQCAGGGAGGRDRPIPRPGAARRGGRAGELHELLHRQCRGGGAGLWGGERRRGCRGDPGAVPGSAGGGAACRSHPDRGGQLPLHQPADPGAGVTIGPRALMWAA